jgi:hypothetical protein
MRTWAAAFAVFALSAGPALAQWERPWASADGAFHMTLPEMWNIVANDDPDIVLFVRSLGRGPAGPAEIVCAVEKQVVPQDIVFNRDQLNAITAEIFPSDLARETDPFSSMETIDGVSVGAYEVAGRSDDLYEQRFARIFLIGQGDSIARYTAVRTVRPGGDIDFASTRAFLSSLHFNTETTE